MTDLWRGGRLLEMTPEECWSLVEASSVCRVAWCSSDGPAVHPVNYLMVDGALWLRTSARTRLAHEIDDVIVAVEVDEIDPFTRSGWSVLVRGRAALVESRPESCGHWPEADAWPEGARRTQVRVPLTRITGRRLLPS
jgi:uncharacterized protein